MIKKNLENFSNSIEINNGLVNIIEQIINEKDLLFIPHLSEINSITYEFYFFFISNEKSLKNQTYFLKVFSSLSLITMRKKLIFLNEKNFTIIKTIFHQKNHNHILFLNESENCIGVISNLKESLKEQNIGIQTINLNNNKIISLKFAFYENFFGALLDNNCFNFYSVNNQNCLFKFNDFSNKIIDFNFFPTNDLTCFSLEFFSVIFLDQKGNFEILSPLIPPNFTIEKKNFLELKKDKNKNEIYNNIISELEKSISDLNNNLIKIECNNLFQNLIKNISTTKLNTLNVISNYLNDNLVYDGIYVLNNSYPYILIRTSKNIFDILILSTEINLTLKKNSKDEKVHLICLESFIINYDNNINQKIIFRETEDFVFINLNNNICLLNINYIHELNKIINNQNIELNEIFSYKFSSNYKQITKSNNDNKYIIPTPYLNNLILISFKNNNFYKIILIKFNDENFLNHNLIIKEDNEKILERKKIDYNITKIKNDFISLSKNMNDKNVNEEIGRIEIEEDESEKNILSKINNSFFKIENEIQKISSFYKIKADLIFNVLENINGLLINLNNQKNNISEKIDLIENKKEKIKINLGLIIDKYKAISDKIDNIIHKKINQQILNEKIKNIIFTKLKELEEKNKELNSNLLTIKNYNLNLDINIIDFKELELNKKLITKDLNDKLEIFKKAIFDLFIKIKKEFNEISLLENNKE